MTAETRFQFLLKHCRWWSRCNVIQKTAPQLWDSRGRWSFTNCDRMRRTDSRLVQVDDRSCLRDNAAQPIREILRLSSMKSSVDNHTASLNLIRWEAQSQWKLAGVSVMWALRWRPAIDWAAALTQTASD